MKRLLALSVSLPLLALFVVINFNGAGRARGTAAAQTQQTQTTQPPAPAQTRGDAVAPNAAGSVAAQTGETTEARRTLDCQGCHGPGKTLPYLGGSLFYTDEHRAYDSGFHSRAHQNGGGVGKRAANCLDCHTRDGRGDMTTMLPRGDPASPVNRANLANTCGRCHGDPAVMQGSGITTRPFLSFRESVHAEAASRGRLGAAVCSEK
jgi:cytochrome c553